MWAARPRGQLAFSAWRVSTLLGHGQELGQLGAQAGVVVADDEVDQVAERALVPALLGDALALRHDLGQHGLGVEAALGAGLGQGRPP